MKLSIKRIAPIDIGPLRNMIADMYNETTIAYPAIGDEEIDEMMFLILANLRNSNCLYLIAYDGKKPTGFFIGRVGAHPYGKPKLVGIGENIYVVPEKRGSIVGLSLMKRAFEYAVEAGVDGFEAVGTFDGTSKKWEKLGFKPYATQLWLSKEEGEQLFGVKHGKE